MTPPIIPEQDMLVDSSEHPLFEDICREIERNCPMVSAGMRGFVAARIIQKFEAQASLLNMMGEALVEAKEWIDPFATEIHKGIDEALATLKSHVGEK